MMQFTGERVIPGQVNADLWAEHFSRYALAAQFAIGADMLDIGCGSGYGTAHLSKTARTAVGIDVDHDAVVYCKANLHQPNLTFAQASATQLPFPDQSFDLITAFEVIEHITGWRELLIEARRLLRPKGVFLVSTPNKDYYNESRTTAGPNPFHVHEFTYSEFRAALADSFPDTEILLQNLVNGVAFTSSTHSATTSVNAVIEDSAQDPTQAYFYLGLCTLEPRVVDAFVYLPRASNVLREREHHIHSLEEQLRQSHAQYNALDSAHIELGQHLRTQNEWAQKLNEELHDARVSIVRLQAELEKQNSWALGLDQELAQARESFGRLQIDFEDRTRWALSLDQELKTAYERLRALNANLDLITASRWHRLGRKLNLGPNLDPSE